MTESRTIAVIPARLASSRFPGKLLVPLAGQPLLWHVWQRVSMVQNIDRVVVATEDLEILDAVADWGGSALRTPQGAQSGTERIVSVLDQLPADVILNVQGDEPLVAPQLLETLVRTSSTSAAEVVTAVYPLQSREQLFDPSIVKVVRDANLRCIYFSRAAIPHCRDAPHEAWCDRHTYWGHVGVYAFHRSMLKRFGVMTDSPLEQVECLEQLRWLENGVRIEAVETSDHVAGVDTPADLRRVAEALEAQVVR